MLLEEVGDAVEAPVELAVGAVRVGLVESGNELRECQCEGMGGRRGTHVVEEDPIVDSERLAERGRSDASLG